MMSTKNLIFFSLLIFLPVSIAAAWLGWGEIIIFITAALSILPLAGWIGEATEEIAVVLGPSWGGLLNATFGNATELIIALFALKAGLIDVVKASLTGSIISNLLLVMGLSMLLGGLKYKEQAFQPLIARVNASAMNLAVIAILLPTTVSLTAAASLDESVIHTLSNAVAVILMVVYGLSLVFSMKTHAYLLDVGQVEMGLSGDGQESEIANAAPSPTAPPATAAIVAQPDANPGDGDNPGKDQAEPHAPRLWFWVGVLLAATLAVAIESELLVDSLEVATEKLGLTQLFTGVILLPVFGNAAEHASAITVAIKNKMDLAVSVAMGSSLQIALFVGPVLVLAGWFLNQPMDLNFGPLELVAVTVSVLIANSISSDGLSNWLEGVMLVAAYAILSVAFFFYPVV
jgi:Ca2+:H+ antiporter